MEREVDAQTAVALARLPIFAGLPAGTLLQDLTGTGMVFDLDPGVLLAEEGEQDDSVVIVLAGQVQVVLNGRAIAEVSAGGILGEMSAFGRAARRDASLKTRSRCRLLVLEGGGLVAMRRRQSQSLAYLEAHALKSLANRLRRIRAQSTASASPADVPPVVPRQEMAMLLEELDKAGVTLQRYAAPANAMLAQEGRVASGGWWLLSGEVEVGALDWDGRLRPLHTIRPGGLCGLIEMVEGTTSTATLTVKKPAEAISLPCSLYEQYQRDLSPPAWRLRAVLCQSLSQELLLANRTSVRSAA